MQIAEPTVWSLVAGAAVAFGVAGWRRWQRLDAQGPDGDRGRGWAMPIGLLLLSVALVVGLVWGGDARLTYAILGSWAAVASFLFLSRYLAAPNIALMTIPVGAVLVLMVTVAMTEHFAGDQAAIRRDIRWLAVVHILFMSLYTAAALVAGSAAVLFFLIDRQLKVVSRRALRLPALPMVQSVTYHALVIAAALLLGGIATGGVMAQGSESFSLLNGTPLLGLLAMAIMTIVLGRHAVSRLSHRTLAGMALLVMVLTGMVIVSLLAGGRHG